MFNRRKYTAVSCGIVALACSQWTWGAVDYPVVDNTAIHFKHLDINEDGFLDLQEVLNVDRNSFDSADSDRDGLLNPQEFGEFLNNIAEVLKKEQELSKDILLRQATAGDRSPANM